MIEPRAQLVQQRIHHGHAQRRHRRKDIRRRQNMHARRMGPQGAVQKTRIRQRLRLHQPAEFGAVWQVHQGGDVAILNVEIDQNHLATGRQRHRQIGRHG